MWIPFTYECFSLAIKCIIWHLFVVSLALKIKIWGQRLPQQLQFLNSWIPKIKLKLKTFEGMIPLSSHLSLPSYFLSKKSRKSTLANKEV